jgi:hypothetical protein
MEGLQESGIGIMKMEIYFEKKSFEKELKMEN